MIKEILLVILTFLAGASFAFIIKGYTDSQIEAIRILLNFFCTRVDENIKKEMKEVEYICSNDKTVAFLIFVLFLCVTILISVAESSNPLLLLLISLVFFIAGFVLMYYYLLE